LLQNYQWPGNVREIENFCERMILMTDGDEIGIEAVRGQIELMARDERDVAPPGRMTLPEIERRAVLDALVASGWNQSRAARLLGIPRHVLLYRMKKFDIARPDSERDR